MKPKYITRVGEKFGLYTVVSTDGSRSFCRCSCGQSKWILNKNLCTRVNPKCRGCFAKMSVFPHRVVHAVYNAISRCTNIKHRRYADWGGRGIEVCPEWFLSPIAFCEHLVSLPGYDDPLLILDRIDNDGHYEPGNLRWATRSESQKNRRRAVARSESHRENLSAAKRGVPWSDKRRSAHSSKRSREVQKC